MKKEIEQFALNNDLYVDDLYFTKNNTNYYSARSDKEKCADSGLPTFIKEENGELSLVLGKQALKILALKENIKIPE